MGKLQELIQELCPNGVEYKELGKVATLFNGMSGVSLKWRESGNCKFIDYLNCYNNLKIQTNKLHNATVKNLKQRTLKKGDLLFTSASETSNECAICSVIEDDIKDNVFLDDHLFGAEIKDEYKRTISPTFLAYFFHTEQCKNEILKAVRGVTRFYINIDSFKKIKVPTPPLGVQEEIVKILDAMSFNIKELQKELKKEILLRETQYEYYRNMLLNCEKIEFKKYKLSEIFYIKNGYTPSTKNQDFWENGTIPWLRMEDIRQNGNILSDAIKHVTTKAIKGEKLFPADSIMLATSATIGEHALIKVPCLGNQRFTFFSLKEGYEIDMKYMYYYFYLIDKWCKENSDSGTFKTVDMEALKTLEIELPSLEMQKRIVYILDNFETVCKDLKIGLPAEIEKRQIQYEYYRNMLLNLSEAI